MAVRRSLWPRWRWSKVPPTAIEMWGLWGDVVDGGVAGIEEGIGVGDLEAVLCWLGRGWRFVRWWMNCWRMVFPASPSGM